MITDIYRYLGIGLISFILGMNVYILYRVTKSRKIVAHKKVKSFKMMTLAIQWLFINQIALFSMIFFSRYQRLVSHNHILLWIDWAAIPVFISYLLLNIYLIKNYIISAIQGTLFDKSEIHKMGLE